MGFLQVVSNYFPLVIGALAFLILWGFTILAVYAGGTRRGLPTLDKFFWVALAAALPLVGYGIYLFAGPLRWLINLEPRPEGTRREAATIDAGSLPVPAYQPQPAAPAGRRTILHVVSGPLAGGHFTLEHLPILIGRGPDSGVRLADDRRISRRHAEIFEQDGAARIRDLGSMHGTMVNGQAAAGQPLHPGDRISVGDTVLVYQVQ